MKTRKQNRECGTVNRVGLTKILQNERLISKIGVDKAQNGPRKGLKNRTIWNALMELWVGFNIDLHEDQVRRALDDRVRGYHSLKRSYSAFVAPSLARRASICVGVCREGLGFVCFAPLGCWNRRTTLQRTEWSVHLCMEHRFANRYRIEEPCPWITWIHYCV